EATTECTNVDDFAPGEIGASFTVPDTVAEIACTITNTAIPAQLTLLKHWVRGAPGDSAELTITSPTDTDSAVAIVPAGRTGRSTTAATLTLVPGDTVTLSETLPASGRTNAGVYEPISLVCGGEPVDFEEPATGSTATATFTVPSDSVACVFTNEARHAVELTKEWGANAVAGDTADLTIANSTTRAADSARATAPNPPDPPASIIAAAGDSINVEELLSNGAYAASLSCTGGVTPEPAAGTSGSFTVPSDLIAGTDITCTYTNTALYTVELTKEWGPGAISGDTAELTIENGTTGAADSVTARAPNPPNTPASVQASPGDFITLDEVFGPGNVPYDASARCTAGPLTTPVPGTTDEFEVPYDLPAGTTVTCAFTNTARTEPPPTPTPTPTPTPPPPSPPPPSTLPATLSAPVIRTVTSHGRVTPGKPFHDRIHVRQLAGGATADAELYGPFPSRAAATCQARFRVRTLTTRVHNGWNRTPSVRIDAPGVYTWRVTTRADAGNRSATHRCGQAAETTVVAKEAYVAPDVIGGFSGTIRSSDHARRAPLRITMPDIGMHALVRPERIVAGRMTLPRDVTDVGWLRRSAGVGDKIGNAVIGGHVSDRHDSPGAMFHLEKARAGQPIAVTKAGTRYRFKVVSRETFDRRQKLPQRYFATTGAQRLVLISCTGKVVHPNGRFHYTRFLVVVAEPVHKPEENQTVHGRSPIPRSLPAP
ncbi:MAG TPA: sortase, partial [Nocardioides sp.]|nr:sortase [Nocardioides sp.]